MVPEKILYNTRLGSSIGPLTDPLIMYAVTLQDDECSPFTSPNL